MKKDTIIIASLTITLIVLGILIADVLSEDTVQAAPTTMSIDHLTLGMSSVQPLNGLLTIAYENDYFEAEGLDIEVIEFNSGKDALQAFLGGSLDVTVTGEVPVMYSSLQGNEFFVISQLVEKTNADIRIVALRDGDLTTPTEYFNSKKRKLATSFGGGPEFYTYNFLKKYNITDVELISQKPSDMPAALVSGSVDAIAVFEPFAFFAEDRLGDDVISFSDESLYSEHFVLVAGRDWAEENPLIVEKLVRSLLSASHFMEENPDEARAIVAEYTRLDESTVESIWNKYVFKPALTASLIEYLEEEAEWAIETGKAEDVEIPDFMEYIYSDAMESVAPGYLKM